MLARLRKCFDGSADRKHVNRIQTSWWFNLECCLILASRSRKNIWNVHIFDSFSKFSGFSGCFPFCQWPLALPRSRGLSSLDPRSSYYLTSFPRSALGKLQEVLSLLAEWWNFRSNTRRWKDVHLTNQSLTSLWLSTLEWNESIGRLNSEATVKHLDIRRDMMELLIMGKHSIWCKWSGWMKQLPGPQKRLSKPPELWRCNIPNGGDDEVKATRWKKVNILSRTGSDTKQELNAWFTQSLLFCISKQQQSHPKILKSFRQSTFSCRRYELWSHCHQKHNPP